MWSWVLLSGVKKNWKCLDLDSGYPENKMEECLGHVSGYPEYKIEKC
jgi:hypothetical protein